MAGASTSASPLATLLCPRPSACLWSSGEKETKAQGSILRLEKRGRAWMDAKSSCGPWARP